MTADLPPQSDLSKCSYLQVATTLASEEEALRLAQAIIEQHLAACVQVVGPVTSVYRWRGAVETSREWQCVMKTSGACYAELAQAIAELHPYEVPELIATEIVAGSPAYLAWITQETKPT
jgi:periplasmic divalent cation tolerance protein